VVVAGGPREPALVAAEVAPPAAGSRGIFGHRRRRGGPDLEGRERARQAGETWARDEERRERNRREKEERWWARTRTLLFFSFGKGRCGEAPGPS
jgi:hypothetical protein